MLVFKHIKTLKMSQHWLLFIFVVIPLYLCGRAILLSEWFPASGVITTFPAFSLVSKIVLLMRSVDPDPGMDWVG